LVTDAHQSNKIKRTARLFIFNLNSHGCGCLGITAVKHEEWMRKKRRRMIEEGQNMEEEEEEEEEGLGANKAGRNNLRVWRSDEVVF
jgi:hypothetical protein